MITNNDLDNQTTTLNKKNKLENELSRIKQNDPAFKEWVIDGDLISLSQEEHQEIFNALSENFTLTSFTLKNSNLDYVSLTKLLTELLKNQNRWKK